MTTHNLVRIAGTSTSTLDGIGLSYNIFFQGCRHNCVSCQNPTLQDFSSGYWYSTNELLDHLTTYSGFYDSAVFTGGDPVYQPKALYTLATNCKLPTILYTGFQYNEIPKYLTQAITIVIDGLYIPSLSTGGFPASSNQQIWIQGHPIILSDFTKPLRRLYFENTNNI